MPGNRVADFYEKPLTVHSQALSHANETLKKSTQYIYIYEFPVENILWCGMNKKEIDSMVLEIEKEDSLFSKKAYLDTLAFPASIVGRQDKAKQLLKFLLGYKQGYVVPLISVYGRSGSGKSTIVKFVCENLKDISSCFVNLRKAKTVFGAANQILGELGESNLKSAQGLGFAVENIGSKIESILKQEGKISLSWCLTSMTYCFMTSEASRLILFTS